MNSVQMSEKQIRASLFGYSQIQNEKSRRQFWALQADSLGYGGISEISRVHNVSRKTIHKAIQELDIEGEYPGGRQRKEGAGRPTFRSEFSKHMAKQIDEHRDIYIFPSTESDSSSANGSEIDEECSEREILLDYDSRKDDTPALDHCITACNENDQSNTTTFPERKARKRRGLDINKMIENHSNRLQAPSPFIHLPHDYLAPESWIEQIIQEQFAAVYGNPCMPQLYVNLTLKEIKSRFESRVHKSISITTLWNIMQDMGYSLHKNMKYEQLGEPHPQRNDQFIIIQRYIDDFKKSGDIVFSIDSKAAVKMGEYGANGSLWCPSYEYLLTLDHDFAQLFKDRYPEGSDLIPPEFMNKLAIVKLSGVYDVFDNSAHVTVGISKDTSEFAGVSLKNSWEKVKSRYPSAKRILILGDGGGSNRSTGYLWKNEIANFSKLTGLPVMMCHYPPGCSKYDPIEHRVWSMVSKNWQGYSLVDCERVLYFLNATKLRLVFRLLLSLMLACISARQKRKSREFRR